MKPKLQAGDVVTYARKFLLATGITQHDIANRRGVVTERHNDKFVRVRWADLAPLDDAALVCEANLVRKSDLHKEAY